MSDHSHHGHHMGHHNHNTMVESSNDTGEVFSTVPTTLMQAVVTTVMAHAAHQGHAAVQSQHAAGHSMPVETSDVHAAHMGGMDHMQMFFHFGVDSVILFKEWSTSSAQGLIFSCIGIIILSMLYEGLKYFREFLFKKYFTSLEYSSVSVLGEDGKPITEVHKVARNRMLSWPHMTQTLLHCIQMVLSYFLMLIVMTYSVWLFGSVVLGSGLGYFLFGWKKATVVDITEHCH